MSMTIFPFTKELSLGAEFRDLRSMASFGLSVLQNKSKLILSKTDDELMAWMQKKYPSVGIQDVRIERELNQRILDACTDDMGNEAISRLIAFHNKLDLG